MSCSLSKRTPQIRIPKGILSAAHLTEYPISIPTAYCLRWRAQDCSRNAPILLFPAVSFNRANHFQDANDGRISESGKPSRCALSRS